MKFISFLNQDQEERLGLWYEGKTFDLAKSAEHLDIQIPSTMMAFLQNSEPFIPVPITLGNA